MRYLFFVFVFSFTLIGYSQSYISQVYMTAVSYSIKIRYSSAGYSYSKPYTSVQHYAQATLQARYDYNHQWCSNEYYAVKNLTLVNNMNRSILTNYKNQRLPWVYNAIKTWNLGVDQNAYKIINYCSEIFNYQYIKDEISLLKAINSEIIRLKNSMPEKFHLSSRYKELAIVLSELNQCSSRDISSLAWKYGLF
jgi:hypothetical protein